ncbi:tripartite tricarboxylate transporter permease [Anaerovirgula multivorans]|uniref:tripartite tricarboxylate transporter permease n=1 Tax=Anaerovirgula multivorans TaxID=312168 RepID=UPI0038BC74FD
MIPSWSSVVQFLPLSIRTSILGVIVGALILSNIFMLVFGLTGVKIFTKIVEVPKGILIPVITILSVIGSYTINNNINDIYWMIGFGIFGYILKTYDYPVGPLVLGIILGPLLDVSYRRAVMTAQGTITGFLLDILKNPISLTLLTAIIVMILAQNNIFTLLKDKLKSKNKESDRENKEKFI